MSNRLNAMPNGFAPWPNLHPLLVSQGMGEVTDAGVTQLASLSSLEELELQFAW